MRTTVNLDPDVASEVARLQRERGLGLSAAVNELARAGFSRPRGDYAYTPPSFDLGLQVDISDIGGVLELLDEADRGARSAS